MCDFQSGGEGGGHAGEHVSLYEECSPNSRSTNSVPTIVTEESAQPNYLISTITHSDDGDWRWLEEEYFITKNQRRNDVAMNQNKEEWSALRKKVMLEIDSYLHGKMLLKAQRIGLMITDNDRERLVSSFSEIGKAFSQDDSVDCAVKINKILTESFDDGGIFGMYCETKVMTKLRLKYIETENNDKDIGSIARMVVKRKCDLAKVINKRAQVTHQQKNYLQCYCRSHKVTFLLKN